MGFFQIFLGRPRSGEILFFPLKTKKTTFCCWNFENTKGDLAPCPPSDAHIYVILYMWILWTNYCITKWWPIGPLQQSLSPWFKPLVTPLPIGTWTSLPTCIAAHLQHILPWVSREISYPGIFSANFHSGSVARSKKLMKCMMKALLKRCW